MSTHARPSSTHEHLVSTQPRSELFPACSPGSARTWRRYLLLLLALPVLLSTACATAIGDDCSSDAQCPAGAYCDKTMPDGLCTIADCRPGQCPDESVCVEFANGQSFCMAACKEDGDCRDGWSCIKDIGLWPFCSVKK